VVPVALPKPPTPPITPPDKPTPVKSKYLWDTPAHTRHSVRVICDEHDLSWEDKNLICAVVQAESGFNIKARNQNKRDGKVLSTDWGVAQINDFYHIGKGKSFTSVEEVLSRPELSIHFMIRQFKAGRLNWWIAYKNKSYLKYLDK